MKQALRLFPLQWLGNLLLMLLAAVWLQIPDSHTWQFVFSLFSGVLLVIAFVALYTRTFRTLRPCAARPPQWRSWLFLLAFIALWCLLLVPIAAGRTHETLFAGYWNSKSPPWLRYYLGYSQLVAWQERLYDCAQWLWAALLLPFAVEATACGTQRPNLIRAASVLRHWLYWLAALVCGYAGSTLTWALADWTPTAGLVGQALSVLARLSLAYTFDILLWCAFLAILSHYLNEPQN